MNNNMIKCTLWTKEINMIPTPYYPAGNYTCVSSRNSNAYMQKCIDIFLTNGNAQTFEEAFIIPTELYHKMFDPLFEQIVAVNKSLKDESKEPLWILTDDDCYQWTKKLNEDCYQFLMILSTFDNKYNIIMETVSLNEFLTDDEDDMKNIQEIIQAYDYDSLDDLKEIYGDSWKQILAECIFENNAFSADVLAYDLTWEDAIEFINGYVSM